MKDSSGFNLKPDIFHPDYKTAKSGYPEKKQIFRLIQIDPDTDQRTNRKYVLTPNSLK
jgi:hypothetical protein